MPLKMSLEIYYWPWFAYRVSGAAQRKENIYIVLRNGMLPET